MISSKRQLGASRRRVEQRNPSDATLRIGATMALPGVLRSLGADPAEVLAEAGFDLTAIRQSRQPDFLRGAGPSDQSLRCQDRLPTSRIAGRSAGQLECPGIDGPAGEVLAGRWGRAAQSGPLSASSRSRRRDFAGNAWQLDRTGLCDPSIACSGHRPGRRRRARADVQHHARIVRRRMEARRDTLCPPQAGGCRSVPPVLPGPAALRRGTKRVGVFQPLAATSIAGYRSRVEPAAAKTDRRTRNAAR